ncbi:hypothetical protein HGB07_06045, partial [Candidatus Roizmanbacteria bacterium]|nr:hypothetical protein [Candidatus Roizmanbacteria bacterium]
MTPITDLTLLTQSLEQFQKITIDDKLIFISVLDSWQIDDNTGFSSGQIGIENDYTGKLVYIFAENLLIATSNPVKFKGGSVSTYSMTVHGEGIFDVSGNAGKGSLKNLDPKKNGENGTAGENSGNLNLYLELAGIENPCFRVVARGGKGGAGQDCPDIPTSKETGDGSIGGNGGNGG